MPRTKGTKRPDPNGKPLDRYEKLQYHDKLICFNYYQFGATAGSEGWNPTEAGSVYHQRSSNYLLSLGSASWFRHRANSMVTLAEAFAKINQAPPQPQAPPNAAAAAAARNVRPRQEEDFPHLPQLATPMNSPPGRAPRTPRTGESVAPLRTAAVAPEAADEEGLPVATAFGMYKQFNYTTRKTTKHMLIRSILHNGVELQDVEFEWITPRKLKLRVAWPEWFQMAEQMAQFTLDESGNMVFPPEHPLTMDMSERNQALVEEDNRIWDTGFIQFERDMNCEDPIFELLDVEITSKNTTVNVLQIYVE